MRLALVVLLLPSLAAAEKAAPAPKFTTKMDVRVDDGSKLLAVAVKGALGSKLDACWTKVAKVSAKVTYEDGKPTTVEVTGAEGKVKTCVARVLSESSFSQGNGKNVATLELEGEKTKVLDAILSTNTTGLSKFVGIKGTSSGSVGFGSGTGTGVGMGTGTGTLKGSKGSGTGGGGNVEGDFVTKGPISSSPRAGGTGPGGGTAQPTTVNVGFDGAQIQSSGLTADEINRVIKSRAGVFRACYQKELNRNPSMAGGKLVVRFEIADDGTVKSAKKASSTLKVAEIETCIIANVLRLKFPAKGKAIVNYPFIFSSAQ